MNEHTRLRTALFQDAFASLLHEINKNQEWLVEKNKEALVTWALAKMGKQKSQRYLIRALENFLVEAAGLMVTKNWNAQRALKDLPLIIPTRFPGSNPHPYQLLTDPNLLQVADDYAALSEKVKELKSKRRSDAAAFRRDLTKLLIGGDQKWINGVELSTEPSDIVTLYLTKKYPRLGIKPEMLKKRLAAVNDETNLLRWIDKSIAKAIRPPR